MHFLVETDHSPLAEIFKKTSPTLLHDCKDCSWDAWNFEIELRYRRQENIPVTDALSLVCLKKEERTFASQNSEWCKADFNIHILSYEHRFGEVSASKGSVNTRVKKSPTNGWPSQRIECPKELWEYWNHRCDLTLEDSLILKSDRIDRICEDRFWI